MHARPSRPLFKAPRILNTSLSQSPTRRRAVVGQWHGPENSNLPLVGRSTSTPAALGGVYGFGLRVSVISPSPLAFALAVLPGAPAPDRTSPRQERAPYIVETVHELMDEHDRVLVGSVTSGEELVAVDNVMIAKLPLSQVVHTQSAVPPGLPFLDERYCTVAFPAYMCLQRQGVRACALEPQHHVSMKTN